MFLVCFFVIALTLTTRLVLVACDVLEIHLHFWHRQKYASIVLVSDIVKNNKIILAPHRNSPSKKCLTIFLGQNYTYKFIRGKVIN